MKTILSILLSLSIMITMSCPIFATSYEEETKIEASGLTMSSEDFKNVFSGNPSTRMDISKARTTTNATISITDVIINDDIINFTVNLVVGNKVEQLPVKGKLASGYKS